MIRRLVLSASVLALAGSCNRETPAPPGADRVAPAMSSATAAMATLDGMDKRAPVPLLPMMANHQKQNMRDHLLVVQEIVAALATDDYPSIERAVSRIGFSEPMGQMCTHMGAGAPSFTEQALEFHHTADRIGTAARDRDRTRVLTELGATLNTCTSCHATWKQQVVDDPTWQALTSTSPPKHSAPH